MPRVPVLIDLKYEVRRAKKNGGNVLFIEWRWLHTALAQAEGRMDVACQMLALTRSEFLRRCRKHKIEMLPRNFPPRRDVL